MFIGYFELCKVPREKFQFWIGVDPVQKDNPDGTNIRLEIDAPWRRLVMRLTQDQAVKLFEALADALTARERKINIPRPPWRERKTHFEHQHETPKPEDDTAG